MATKASGTLVLIIEKQHTSWGLMVTALPALEVHFRCQLRIASARPILGPSGPCARVAVHVYVELSYGLPLACTPFSGRTAEACLAAVGLMYCEFGCRLASYGAPMALEAVCGGGRFNKRACLPSVPCPVKIIRNPDLHFILFRIILTGHGPQMQCAL